MPTYPGGIPALGTLTGADTVDASDINNPNREIEAICTELGVLPKSIDDTVAPGATPASVAAYLDMMGNIVKTLAGVDASYKAAVPPRNLICGHGAGGIIPDVTGGSRYPYLGGGAGLSATEADAFYVITFNGQLVLKRLFVELLTAQPDNDLYVIVKKNGSFIGTASNYPRLAIPASSPAGIYHMLADSGLGPVAFSVNDTLSLDIWNKHPTLPGPQIGAIGVEFEQVG
jgi:hypothetical protein